MAVSDNGFQQMSFVNSIATTKGGRHVDYVSKMIENNVAEVLKKKNKGGVTIKPHQIRYGTFFSKRRVQRTVFCIGNISRGVT